MFVNSSEISISVIVKHVQHVGIIRAFWLSRAVVILIQCKTNQFQEPYIKMLFMGYVKMYILFSSQIQFDVLDKICK